MTLFVKCQEVLTRSSTVKSQCHRSSFSRSSKDLHLGCYTYIKTVRNSGYCRDMTDVIHRDIAARNVLV